uniref:ER membrane protein complex subunit 3 n=1 Tax=Rhinopithecus bieti TaxID=61621 RepID=A0A2K6JQP1_RHIBE
MAGPELLLDSNIRLWVVLPIVIITFFVGMIRHYVSILLQSDKKLTQEQVSDSQVLIRSRVLRENGKYIPKQSFLTRKYYFNNPEDGFFKKTKRKVVPPSPMTVSSASWYFLNVFGLRSIYSLILGQDNAADQSRMMQEQMTGAAMAMPADTNKAFKTEWEALELTDHQWALDDVEEELMAKDLHFEGMFKKELQTSIF